MLSTSAKLPSPYLSETEDTNTSSSNWPYTCPQTQKQLTTQAVILGLGSMFNHSTQHQNVGWERNVANKVIVYKTLREIEEGEELCISYGSRLWFKDADVGEEEDEGDGLGVLGGIEV